MKKLIVLSVVFALVAVAAFAVDVSAEVIGMTNLISGDSGEDSKVEAGGWPGGTRRVRVFGEGQNEEGTFGAWFRFEHYGQGGLGNGLSGMSWWKPIDQFKLTLGINPDGFYGRDGVTGWGFYQVPGDTNVVVENWRFGASFYGSWGQNGLLLSITPIEPLLIFFGVPFPAGGEAKDVYGKFHAQIAYDISGIGNFALTYASDLGDKVDFDPTTFEVDSNGGKLFAYFGLSAIENLGLDIGLGFKMPVTQDDVTYNAPLAVGLGLKFDAGAFGVKVRFQGQFGESISAPGLSEDWKGNTVIDADVQPYFAVSDTVTVLFSAGLQITSPGDNENLTGVKPGDPVVGWHIEPYIAVKAGGWWAPGFFAGLRIESDGVKGIDSAGKETDPIVKWSVPIGLCIGF